MTSQIQSERILACNHGEFLARLEVATSNPVANGMSALKVIATMIPGLSNAFFTNKGSTRDVIMAVNLVDHPIDWNSTLAWLTEIGATQIADAMVIFDEITLSDPLGAAILAEINAKAATEVPSALLGTYIDRFRVSRVARPAAAEAAGRVIFPASDWTELALPPGKAEELARILDEVNGQDAYDVELTALRRVKPTEYLVVTEAVAARSKAVREVDIGTLCFPMSNAEKTQLLALNMASLAGNAEAFKIAMTRVYMIEHGYLRLNDAGKQANVTHNEVRITCLRATPAEVLAATDAMSSAEGKAFMPIAKIFGLIAPVMASDVFLRTGHHYLSGALYDQNYERLFRAATLDDLIGKMSSAALFHVAVHWIGPSTMRRAWTNLLTSNQLPTTFKTRYRASPAGCAIVTTTNAVLAALSTLGCYAEVEELYGASIAAVRAVDTVIKEESTRYFTLPGLFGVAALTADERANIERAKEHAIRLAPICKAFLNTVAKDTAMARAKVLDKYAEMNMGVKNIAERWFKNYQTKAAGADALRAALGVK